MSRDQERRVFIFVIVMLVQLLVVAHWQLSILWVIPFIWYGALRLWLHFNPGPSQGTIQTSRPRKCCFVLSPIIAARNWLLGWDLEHSPDQSASQHEVRASGALVSIIVTLTVALNVAVMGTQTVETYYQDGRPVDKRVTVQNSGRSGIAATAYLILSLIPLGGLVGISRMKTQRIATVGSLTPERTMRHFHAHNRGSVNFSRWCFSLCAILVAGTLMFWWASLLYGQKEEKREFRVTLQADASDYQYRSDESLGMKFFLYISPDILGAKSLPSDITITLDADEQFNRDWYLTTVTGQSQLKTEKEEKWVALPLDQAPSFFNKDVYDEGDAKAATVILNNLRPNGVVRAKLLVHTRHEKRPSKEVRDKALAQLKQQKAFTITAYYTTRD